MVSELYLAAFGRLPQPAELSEAGRLPAGRQRPKAGLADLTWVMLNSKEFLFNH